VEAEKLTLSTRSSSIPRTRRKQKNTRGYGRSKIPSLRWLTTDQAMADYADLILELRSANSTVFEARNPAPAASLSSSTPPKLDFSSSPLRGGAAGAAVIGFGGSYGGMLAAWMRMRYPSAVDGVVAASAPIWSYGGLDPEFDAGSFAATVTDDAGPKGGASEACSENVREAWKVLFASVEDENGEPGEGGRVTPAAASAALRLCSPSGAAGGEHQSRALATREDAQLVADWASAAFDSCAMGMFPYPSSYMLNGDAELPAWPMRAICGGRLSEANLTSVAVLEALAEGISVYFNATRDAVCYDPLGGGGSSSDATDEDGSLWGWQYCSQVRLRERARERAREMEKFLDFVCFASLRGGLLRGRARSVDRERAGYAFLRPRTISFHLFFLQKNTKQQFMPFSKDGVRDMFWPAPWDAEAAVQACRDQFGVAPDPLYASRAWGGKRISWPPSALTNAVFSNGLLDPWHGGGVLEQLGFDDSVAVVLIPEGGHHVDLFFENEADPPSVKEAREVERRAMRRWVEEVRARKEGAGAGRNDDERGSVASV